jgi:20S proteasome alpha/beta subunit
MKSTLIVKPFPRLNPTPERLVRGKKMTVAAGFVCKDGIVLCADSQESAGGYKFPVEKILTRIDPYTEIAIAGSGCGPLVDMAAQRVAQSLMGGYDDYLIIENRIADALAELYEKSFRLYPVENQDDSIVELLIAVKLRKHDYPFLYHSTATAVTFVPEYAIIGSGRVVQYEVQNLYGKFMSVQRGILLAVQLLHVAKSVLNTVGGRGKIVTLHDADLGIGQADVWQISESEKAFQQFTMFASSLLLGYVDLTVSDQEFVTSVKGFAENVFRMRSEYRATSDQWKAVMQALMNPIPLEKLEEKQREDQKNSP